MFRLISKKGFTLVELMIVVVILGILVGVAVPIYSIVTKNAEKKTCFANMRMITSACIQFFLNYDSYANLVPASGTLDLSTDTVPDEFVEKFDAVGIPKCPSGGKYVIECPNGVADTTIKVTCQENGEGTTGHGDYHPSENNG